MLVLTHPGLFAMSSDIRWFSNYPALSGMFHVCDVPYVRVAWPNAPFKSCFVRVFKTVRGNDALWHAGSVSENLQCSSNGNVSIDALSPK